jgi:hypothetical protein
VEIAGWFVSGRKGRALEYKEKVPEGEDAGSRGLRLGVGVVLRSLVKSSSCS